MTAAAVTASVFAHFRLRADCSVAATSCRQLSTSAVEAPWRFPLRLSPSVFTNGGFTPVCVTVSLAATVQSCGGFTPAAVSLGVLSLDRVESRRNVTRHSPSPARCPLCHPFCRQLIGRRESFALRRESSLRTLTPTLEATLLAHSKPRWEPDRCLCAPSSLARSLRLTWRHGSGCRATTREQNHE